MKKLLNILVLASALFLTACGPSYDFSSPESFGESLAEQAKKENLALEEASSILSAYLVSEVLTNWKDLYPEVLDIEDEKDLERTLLSLLGNAIKGKTFDDMKDDTAPAVFELVDASIYAGILGDERKIQKIQMDIMGLLMLNDTIADSILNSYRF